MGGIGIVDVGALIVGSIPTNDIGGWVVATVKCFLRGTPPFKDFKMVA